MVSISRHEKHLFNLFQQLKLERCAVKIFGGPGTENGQFRNPVGLETDYEGNIIINDAGNDRLQVRLFSKYTDLVFYAHYFYAIFLRENFAI